MGAKCEGDSSQIQHPRSWRDSVDLPDTISGLGAARWRINQRVGSSRQRAIRGRQLCAGDSLPKRGLFATLMSSTKLRNP
jgi:hypothetical protein